MMKRIIRIETQRVWNLKLNCKPEGFIEISEYHSGSGNEFPNCVAIPPESIDEVIKALKQMKERKDNA